MGLPLQGVGQDQPGLAGAPQGGVGSEQSLVQKAILLLCCEELPKDLKSRAQEVSADGPEPGPNSWG